jgi:hypothetical protein
MIARSTITDAALARLAVRNLFGQPGAAPAAAVVRSTLIPPAAQVTGRNVRPTDADMLMRRLAVLFLLLAGCSGSSENNLAALCVELRAELNAVQTCTSADDCGQVMTGTSCGCTRNLVARSDADLSTFSRLKAEVGAKLGNPDEPIECRGLQFGSTCDCPVTDGFTCTQNRCAWNYTGSH